jgi:8-oxo-dGTP pyrophosphatase MutT (NUDIX family)
MTVEQFCKILSQQVHHELPGSEVQLEMAPPMRALEMTPKSGYRVGAVALVLCEINDEWNIILMRRTADSGVHSGQISFPGGKYDDTDFSYLFTAMRELEEEIGISAHHYKVIGSLTPLYIPPSKFLVYPQLFVMHEPPKVTLSEAEVVELLYFPLKELQLASSKSVKEVGKSDDPSNRIITPVYVVDELNFIWGATAMMLRELEVLLNRIRK